MHTLGDENNFETRPSQLPIKITEQEKLDDFNLKDNIKDLDTSFMTCLVSVLFKRYANYKRNRKAFFNEVVVPAAIVVIGFGLS